MSYVLIVMTRIFQHPKISIVSLGAVKPRKYVAMDNVGVFTNYTTFLAAVLVVKIHSTYRILKKK